MYRVVIQNIDCIPSISERVQSIQKNANSDKHLLKYDGPFWCSLVIDAVLKCCLWWPPVSLKRNCGKNWMLSSVVNCVKTVSCSLDKWTLSFTKVSLVPFWWRGIWSPLGCFKCSWNYLRLEKHSQPWKTFSLGCFNEAPNSFCQFLPGFWKMEAFDRQVYRDAVSTNCGTTAFLSIKADPLHKKSLPLRILSVNVTKSIVSY